MGRPENLSPAMTRVLKEIEDRADEGWYLRRSRGWWWTRGPISRPAPGIRMDTVAALIRRKWVKPENLGHFEGFAYHLSRATGEAQTQGADDA